MTKVRCNTCGKLKLPKQMRPHRPQCKVCRANTVDNYYTKNRNTILAQHKKRYLIGGSRVQKLDIIRRAKNRPCSNCNARFPFYVMDFDHFGTKKFGMAQAETRSIKSILKEIQKCNVLCANCHRDKTYNERVRSSNRLTIKKKLLNKLKSVPCSDCGKCFNPWQLDFDHISNKRANVSALLRSSNWQAVLHEIKECVIRCANCHRIKTYKGKKFAAVWRKV